MAMGSVDPMNVVETREAMHFTLGDERQDLVYNQHLLAQERYASDMAEPDFGIYMANSFWLRPGIDPKTELARNYGASGFYTDFGDTAGSARRINRWVELETAGLIPDLLEPSDLHPEYTLEVLVNVIALKGKWFNQFPRELTQDEAFNTRGGGAVTVPMMHNSADFQPYAITDTYAATDLTFRHGSVSMRLIAPTAEHFDIFADELDAQTIEDVRASLKTDATVNTSLPRFSIQTKVKDEAAKYLGTRAAALQPVVAKHGVEAQIDNIIQQVVLEVDEDGAKATAATAATAVIVNGGNNEPEPPTNIIDVAFDRPFYYVIQDRQDGTVYFIGRVLEP